MTEGVFHLIAQLGKGLLVSVWHEQRIIAETSAAARHPQQSSRRYAFENTLLTAGPDGQQHTAELRATTGIGDVADRRNQFGQVRRTVALRTSVVGRLDTRRAVEGID